MAQRFDETPGSGNAMQFLHGCHDIVKMTQRMAAHHVVEGIVSKWPRVDVQIMDDVDFRGYHIVDTHEAGQFSRPASDVEFPCGRVFARDCCGYSAHVCLPVKNGGRRENTVHSWFEGIQHFHPDGRIATPMNFGKDSFQIAGNVSLSCAVRTLAGDEFRDGTPHFSNQQLLGH